MTTFEVHEYKNYRGADRFEIKNDTHHVSGIPKYNGLGELVVFYYVHKKDDPMGMGAYPFKDINEAFRIQSSLPGYYVKGEK